MAFLLQIPLISDSQKLIHKKGIEIKNNKKIVTLSVITSLLSSNLVSISAIASEMKKDQLLTQNVSNRLALEQSTEALMTLVIATQMVEKNVGQLVRVDKDMENKYLKLRNLYLGSVPTSIVGTGAAVLTYQSLEDVEFLVKPITWALRLLQKSSYHTAKYTSERIEDFLKLTGLDVVLERSSDNSSRVSENIMTHIIKPILESSITKNALLSSAAVSTTAIAGGSSFFFLNSADEALSNDLISSILGQDKVVSSRIQAAVNQMGDIYSLTTKQKDKLSIAIIDSVLKQAIQNKFSQDSKLYKLNVIDLMAKNSIISSEKAQAIRQINQLIIQLSKTTVVDESVTSVVVKNIDAALSLSAALEQQLVNGAIDDDNLRAEIERMLGAVNVKIMTAGYNLQKSK